MDYNRFYVGSFCQALFLLRLVQDYIPEPEVRRPSLRRRPDSYIMENWPFILTRQECRVLLYIGYSNRKKIVLIIFR
jgi:hypothetical protein